MSGSIFALLFLLFAVGYVSTFFLDDTFSKFSIHRSVYNRINPTLVIPDKLDIHLQGDVLNKVTMHDQPNPIPSINNDDVATNTNKSGYGIVYTGNVALFPLIYVSISVLNYMGFTSYPIEIFVNGVNYEQDMQQCHKQLVSPFISKFTDIRCIYIDDTKDAVWQHFGYKPMALLRSSFQHVLFLDDDNIIIQSPQILFESAEYRENHAIFWPDFWGKHCDGLFPNAYILYGACLRFSEVYGVLNDTYIEYDENNLKYTQSQEAAQLVVDTVLYYDTLQAVLDCTESTQLQGFLHGDKDCFRFMWLERNQSFYYVPIMPQYTGFTTLNEQGENYFHRHALFQFWRSQESVMFIHQTKWIEPMDHALWQYYQQFVDEWVCAVHDGQDIHFPFPNERQYVITQTKTGKENGELISKLEPKWAEFWHAYQDMNTQT